ncbi:OB-fold protein [Georgenia yuyongxinii]|uniref:DUF4190 domain-containing protein n=1 Tax=Georgenia yuyongxinii TaxID=2589797 RepID=A0A552WTG6_9MICO|nr:hypothetical protein [Georgenia yuyongxinii]TRW45603.1 hypothetical protein FJ693_08705 [Georgenia yuyongxinii]
MTQPNPPSFGAPQYEPPQYGQAPAGQPAASPYEQPETSQASYGQPQFDQSQHQQQYVPQPPYPPQRPGSGMAIAAFVIGLVAFLLAWIPIINVVSIVGGIVAVVLGVIAIRKASRGEAGGKGLSIAALVLAALAIIGSILMNMVFGALVNEVDKSVQGELESASAAIEEDVAAGEALENDAADAEVGGTTDAPGLSQETDVVEAALAVSAQQLIDDLDANALAAANKYEGQWVTVTGTLSNIDASGDYFSLTGSQDDFSFTNVQIFIDESHLDTVAAFTSGQEVTVTGKVTGVGEILGYSIDADTIG